MTVRRSINQSSGLYCSSSGFPPAGSVPGNHFVKNQMQQPNCRANTIAFDAPLGSLSPTPNAARVEYGFEVVAVLLRGSNPNACTEGQLTQEDTVVDSQPPFVNGPVINAPGVISLARGPGQPPEVAPTEAVGKPVPNINPTDWGGDDYTTVGDVKVHELKNPPIIRWVDLPGATVGAVTVSLVSTRRFISYVIGTANQPTCWCKFEIIQRYDVAGAKVTAPPANRTDGFRCTLN
jgi:hypothetical protein